MVQQAGSVEVEVKANLRRYQQGMDRAKNDAARFNQNFNRGMHDNRRAVDALSAGVGRLSGSLGGAATNAAALAGALLAAGGAAVAVQFAEFEAQMNQVRAVSGATREEMGRMAEKAQELGATTKFSARQVADAMGFMAQAGLNTGQIFGAISPVLDLAAAANIDLAQSADIVTNIMTAMGISVEELSRVNDVLVNTITTTNTNLNQLGFAFKFAAPVANAAGVALEDLAAALGLLGNAGVQGTMAGTTMRRAIIGLLAPTKEAQEIMDQFGIKVRDASGKLLPLRDIIEQFGPLTSNVEAFIKVFGIRGSNFISVVKEGTEAFDEQLKKTQQWGRTQEIAQIQMEGLKGASIELLSALQGLAIAIGQSGFGGALEGFVDTLTARIREMTQALKELQDIELQSKATVSNTIDNLEKELSEIDQALESIAEGPISRFQQLVTSAIFGEFSKATETTLKMSRERILKELEVLRSVAIAKGFQEGTSVVNISERPASLPIDEDLIDTLDSTKGVDKRALALQQLMAVELEFLRVTNQQQALLKRQEETELARLQSLLNEKLITEEEFQRARLQLADITAKRMAELNEEAIVGLQEISSSISSNLEGAFREFVDKGKLDFKELARSMLADIIMIQLRLRLLQPLFGNGGFDSTGGIFGSVISSVFHGGGKVGLGGVKRAVPEALFLGAPRLQSGGRILRDGEIPAILHRGEEVIPASQVGRGGSSVKIQINNMSGGEVSTRRMINGDGEVVQSITIFPTMRRNEGAFASRVSQIVNRGGRNL